MITMASLEVIKPGLMTSIQDFGRKGLSFFAIPGAGVMDENAARIALLLLGLPEDHPLIECTAIAPSLRFHGAVRLAISGADFGWQLNGQPVSPNSIVDINDGDVLQGYQARQGFRGYIALDGALRVKKILGSYATYMPAALGGFSGRLLQRGDVLAWDSWQIEKNTFDIYAGPEFASLSANSQERLKNISYELSPDSNRMGLRLRGPLLSAEYFQLTDSRPVLPGFLQLPPSGQPIIVLQDGQTTGGYPRIAYLARPDLGRLNQIHLGAEIQLRLHQSENTDREGLAD